MHITIHARPQIPWQRDYSICLSAGLAKHGISNSVQDYDSTKGTIAIILGPHWGRHLEMENFLQVNRAFIGKSEYDDSDTHCISVGWCGMNGRADFCLNDIDKDRWKLFMKEDDIHEYHKEGGVVLCGQADNGRSAVELADFYKHSKMAFPDAVFREHPSKPQEYVHNWSDTKLAVTLNSTVAVDALLNGNSVVSCDEGNPVYAWTQHNTADEYLYPDQIEIVQTLANCQYTRKEIQNGRFWEILSGERNGPLSSFHRNESKTSREG